MDTSQKNTLNYIENVQGIGIIKAKSSYEKLIGLKIINPSVSYSEKDIRAVLFNNRGHLDLPTESLYDLEYNPEKQIPRNTIDEFNKLFKKVLGDTEYFIGGSYSREQPTSGDIDLMIVSDMETFNRVFSKPMIKQGKMLPIISQGDNRATTYLIKGKKYYRLDIFLTRPESVIFMRTYLVGSGKFNLYMRASAKRQGLVLNQYGLYHRDSHMPIEIDNEPALFARLGMTWTEYKDRNI